MENKSQAGKGDEPRNCFSQRYRDNYESINWDKKQKERTSLLDMPVNDYSICYDENGVEIKYE